MVPASGICVRNPYQRSFIHGSLKCDFCNDNRDVSKLAEAPVSAVKPAKFA
jgi:hypothetical protein